MTHVCMNIRMQQLVSVWPSSFICVKCLILIHMCDMSHSYGWYAFIHTCNMRHDSYEGHDSYVRHDSCGQKICLCMTHVCFHPPTWVMSHIRVMSLIWVMSLWAENMSLHDTRMLSSIRATCLIHTCGVTHSSVWPASTPPTQNRVPFSLLLLSFFLFALATCNFRTECTIGVYYCYRIGHPKF